MVCLLPLCSERSLTSICRQTKSKVTQAPVLYLRELMAVSLLVAMCLRMHPRPESSFVRVVVKNVWRRFRTLQVCLVPTLSAGLA